MSLAPQDTSVLLAVPLAADVQRYRQLLREMGYTRIQAIQDGLAALFALKRGRTDLLVLAGDLPRLEGIDLLEYLAKIPRFAPPRTLLILAGLTPAALKRGQQAGTSAILAPPFDDRTFAAHVRKTLAARS